MCKCCECDKTTYKCDKCGKTAKKPQDCCGQPMKKQ